MTAFLTRTRGRGRLDWTDWFTYLYLALGLFLMFGPVAWFSLLMMALLVGSYAPATLLDPSLVKLSRR